jgi:hypothetical protein
MKGVDERLWGCAELRREVKFLIVVLWFCSCGTSNADTLPGRACGLAGRAAEVAGSLPANMLVSIGMVESGRAYGLSGRVAAWPWTVNVDGAGSYFASKQDAVAFARRAAASGALDVDVGCFQISLQSHPDAFASLDEAFDPVANANFAAGFLNQLKVETGSWDSAIADYHSAVPELGLPYEHRVLAAWQGLGDFGAELGELTFPAADSGVIMEAPAARLVRVITVDGDGDGATARRKGLPRVVTP